LLESMMLSCAIHTKEGRYIVVTDYTHTILTCGYEPTKVMQYIQCASGATLTIESGEHPSWWVDRWYAIHPDMQSKSGIIMTLGKGANYTASCKMKLNNKSSNEAELVAITDDLG